MNEFFTSDLHFGHQNILYRQAEEKVGYSPEFRWNLGWRTVEEMNERLIEMWNSQVSPGDKVWILGDLCMGKMDVTLPYISRLNGEKILLPGNHDRMHPIQGSVQKQQHFRQRYRDFGIDAYCDLITYGERDGYRYVMCHFPYYGDHTETDRFEDFRPPDEGLPLIHGHVHDEWKYNGKQMNVGYDAWGRLVTGDEVMAFIKENQ